MATWKGCTKDCFHCPYPDCIAPDDVSTSALKETENSGRGVARTWTDEQIQFIRDNASLGLTKLSAEMGIPQSTLSVFVRSHEDLDALVRRSAGQVDYSLVAKTIAERPGITLTELSEILGRKTNTLRAVVFRMAAKDYKIKILGKKGVSTRVWIES